MKRRQRNGGYTAVEVAVASTILLFIAGGSVSVMKTGTDSWKDVRRQTKSNAMAQKALHAVIKNLQPAINVLIDNSDPDASSLTFQVPTKREADGTIEYGAFERETKDGKLVLTPKKGYWAQLIVRTMTMANGGELRQLVLRTLDENRVKIKKEDRVLAMPIDKLFGTRKGFQVSESGGIYAVLVRLRAKDGARQEAYSSGSSAGVDMNIVDSTRNDFDGMSTASLSTQIAALDTLVAASAGTPWEDKLTGAAEAIRDARDDMADDLQDAMSGLKDVVSKIDDAIKDGLSPVDGDPMMDAITQLARQYAADAKNMALVQGAKPTDVSDATNKIAEGDALRAAGDFEAAVNKYKDAVGKVL